MSYFKSPFARKKEEDTPNGGHLDPGGAAPKTPGFLSALFGTASKKQKTESVSEAGQMYYPSDGAAYDSPPLAQYGSPLNLAQPVDLLSGDVPHPQSTTKVARIQPQALQSPWKSQRMNEASSTGLAVYAKSQTWAPSQPTTNASHSTAVATLPTTNTNGTTLSLGVGKRIHRDYRPRLYQRLAQSTRKRGSASSQAQIDRLRKGLQAAESLDFFVDQKPTTHFSKGRILNQSSRLTVLTGKRAGRDDEEEQLSSKRQRRVKFSESAVDDGASTTSRTSSTTSTMMSPGRVLPLYVPAVAKTADGPYVFGAADYEYEWDGAKELHGLNTHACSIPPFDPKPAHDLATILAGIQDPTSAQALSTKDASSESDLTESRPVKKDRNEDGTDWACKKCGQQNDTMASKCKSCDAPRTSPKDVKIGWGANFGKLKEGEWKCKVCMVSNQKDAKACISCETAKPGTEGTASTPSTSAAKPGAIGKGGFSFGAGPAGSGLASGGSTAKATLDTKGPSGAPSGFTFGTSEPSSSSSAPSGFSFEPFGASASKPEKPLGGFSFGAPSAKSSESAKPVSGFSFVATPSPKESADSVSLKAAESKSQVSDASSTVSSGFKFSAGASSTSKDNSDGSKPGFSFGVTPAPAPTGTSFSFGGAPVAETPPTKANSLPSNGDKPAESQPAATAKAFSFGSTKPSDNGVGSSSQDVAAGPVATLPSSQTPPPSEKLKVSFERPATEPSKRRVHESSGDMGTPASTTATSGFSFGAGASNQEGGDRKKKRQSRDGSEQSTNSTSGFSFGGPTPSLPVPSLPAPTPAPLAASESLKAPAFSFGAGSAAEAAPAQAPAPSASFVFAAGSKTEAAAPVVPGFGQSAPASSFGGMGAAPAPNTAGFGAPAPSNTSFGAPTQGPPSFGSPAPAPAVPTFGAPASTPGGVPSFGAPAPGAPTFGASAPAPTVPSFGAPAPAAFGNAGGFGAAPAPFGNPGGGFGNTAPAPPPMQFGAGGSMAAAPGGGFGFNAPAPPAAAPAPFFGNVPPPVPPPSGGFGAPAPSAGFGGAAGFGAPPAPGGGLAPQGFQPQGFGQAPAPSNSDGFQMGTAPRRRRVIRARRP